MLTPWKASYDQPRWHIKKQSHYFANKGPSSQCYGFPSGHVWMWELDCEESWALKNCCFWTVVLEKTLESPWTARKCNQSILKEISPGCSLEGLMLKLKLQYFGHLMRRADSFEKTLMLGKIEGRRRGEQRVRWLDAITNTMDMGLGGLRCCSSWDHRVGYDWVTELNWTDWNNHMISILYFLNMKLTLHGVNIDWFGNIEKSLHACHKCHLITAYDIFVQFSLLVLHWGFLHLCLSMFLACGFLVCDVFVWISYWGDSGFIEQVWEYSSFEILWMTIRRIGVNSFLNDW